MYEGIQSEVISATRFDENLDWAQHIEVELAITGESKVKAEERFPITEQGYMVGKLLDGTECQILLDTGASKSFLSKSHYFCCKSLHSSPKFASKTHTIQVENGQFVSVLFIFPIIGDMHGHRFEMYTIVLEIHENVDIVIGIKNIFQLEGIINSW